MKKFRFIPILAMALTMGMTFVSCDKDENEGGSSKNVAGQLTSSQGGSDIPDGYCVSSVGNYRYYYEDGTLSQIYVDGTYVDFSTKGITVESDEGSIKVSFNSKGLLSKVSYNLKQTENGYSVEDTESITISYNSNNQVTGYSGSWSETASGYGQTYSESGSGSATYSYSGSVIKKVVQKSSYSGKENGEKYSGTANTTFTFDFDREYDNIFGQWTPRLTLILPEDEFFQALSFVGCFGRASSKLPTTIYEEYIETEDGETDEDSDSYSCSYSFNAYGALSQADGKSYSYTTSLPNGRDTKASRAALQNVLKPFVQQPGKGFTSIFRHHRNK